MVKEYSTDRIRNIGVISHGDVGKTSLVESMIFSTGATTRLGKVDDGTTTTDYSDEEIERKITISTSMAFAEWKNHKINILDTPGYSDFIGEVICALRVSDLVVVLLNATAGVEVGTESVWKIAQKYTLPAIVFVNRMDKEHANFEQTLEMAKQRLGSSVVGLQFPVNAGGDFNAVVDLLKMKMLTYAADDSGSYTESDIPANLVDKANNLRKQLEESIAENDEELMEKYFETEKLEDGELARGLKKEILNRNIVPVICGVATANMGSHRLMDIITDYGPSPADVSVVKGVKPGTTTEIELKTDPSEAFSGIVFKTVAEQHVGELSFIRVYSGVLKSGMEVLNTRRESTEKIGQMYYMNGKNRKESPTLMTGDIAALVKLKSTHTNDTLCDKKKSIQLKKIDFPDPVIRTAIVPKTKGDEEKISNGLSSLHEEDPTFIIQYDPEIKQQLMMGQGETQFDIAVKHLKEKFGVEVNLLQPKIPYRETIRNKVEVQGKYKKQSGGRGQYGDCHLRIEPLPRGGGFEFLDEVVGGVIPNKYIPAIEKGIRETMEDGVIAGCQVVDVSVAVYYGSYHSVDSSDMAFKVAASMGFKKGFVDAKPVLLEPIYDIEVTVPEEYMGDVMGDISSRRGKIQGMEAEGPFQIIKAKVPLAELYKYSTSLRSLTQGRGIHKRAFSHYEEVPSDVQQKIVEAHQQERQQ